MPSNLPTTQKPAHNSKPGYLSKFAFYHVAALTYLAAVFGLLAYLVAMGLLQGDMYLACTSGALFLFLLWAAGSNLISVPLGLYVQRYYGQHDFARIESAHLRALSMIKKLPLRRNADTSVLLSNLALMRLCQGSFDSADDLFREALKQLESNKRNATTFGVAIVLNNIGCVCLKKNELIEAELMGTRALEILELRQNKRYKSLSCAPLTVIGTARVKLGEYNEAVEHFEKARQIFESNDTSWAAMPVSREQGKHSCYLWMAFAHAKLGQMLESEKYCDLVLAAAASSPSALSTQALEPLNLLANEYMNNQMFIRADKLLQVAYNIGLTQPMHPDARQLLSFYEKLLLLTNRADEVDDMRHGLMPKALCQDN